MAAGSAVAVRVLRQADFRTRWDSPRADEPGYGRGFIEGVKARNFMANVLVLPVGQGCPKHEFDGDVIVVALSGAVEFVVFEHGTPATHRLEPDDMLFLPAGVPYEYRNAGTEQASFLSVAGRVDEWPAKARYDGVDGDVVVHASSPKES
jgi:quercetin dioxygenase-like cupin family protein